jgi:hypothetical protein
MQNLIASSLQFKETLEVTQYMQAHIMYRGTFSSEQIALRESRDSQESVAKLDSSELVSFQTKEAC